MIQKNNIGLILLISTMMGVLAQNNMSQTWIDEIKHGPKSPIVGQSREKLCFAYNTQNEICYAEGNSVIFREDTVYERSDLKAIIFKETQIQCKTYNQAPCQIVFKLTYPKEATKIELTDYTIISGVRIYFDSPSTQLIIDKTSYLDVSGRSYASLGSYNGQGASFVGQGGYCGNSETQKTYSAFDMLPNPNNIYDLKVGQMQGSLGSINPAIFGTAGGGMVFINVDSLRLNGEGDQIRANGLPLESSTDTSDLNGGSGGYIYVKTANQQNQNYVDSGAKISAVGGFGRNRGYGGAGGVIVFDGSFRSAFLNTLIHGGLSGSVYNKSEPAGCGNGAAGTVWWRNSDILKSHNRNFTTSKFTEIPAKIRNTKLYPGQYMLAENLQISDGANINIKNNYITVILFPTLQMYSNTKMVFDFVGTSSLEVRYRSHFTVEENTLLDFSKISTEVKFQTIVKHKDYNVVRLGETLFSKKIVVESGDIEIMGDVYDPSEVDLSSTSVPRSEIHLLADSKLKVQNKASLQAAKIFLYSNDSLSVEDGIQLRSLIDHECTTQNDGNLDLYQCMSVDFDNQHFDYNYTRDFFNKQYRLTGTQAVQKPVQMVSKILNKWNIYVMALGSLKIDKTKIWAPRIGLCSNQVDIELSQISSSGKGCEKDKGIGAGIVTQLCSGSGASHGGKGGHGSADSDDPQDQAKCMSSYPKPYYFGQEARYEGSGGASGDRNKDTGGAGGGIIWITSPNTTKLQDSKILAEGQWGRVDNFDQLGSGGGSGGSIQITTLNLRGNGQVSVKGGSGSAQGGGGGSGGRLVMNYLKSYLADSQPNQSFYWQGTHDISGGLRGDTKMRFLSAVDGEDGTMFHSKCFPGYSGVFCKPCEVGEYKYDYSFGLCQPCQNKPKNAYYTKLAETTSICQYQCNKYFDKVENNNPDCLDPISLEVQRLGGLIPFFGMMGIYLILLLLIFTMLQYRTQVINFDIKDLHEQLYEKWENNDESQRGRTSEEDYGLKDQNIWSFTHRMYLIGFNSVKFPWFIPKDFPRDALSKSDREKFLRFIDNFNPQLRWTFAEKWIFVAVKILYPPLAKTYHMHVRKRKFKLLQLELYRHFVPQFWGDKGTNKSIRLSCSGNDYQLAYIDFIDFSKCKDNWLGLKLPMAVLLAGNGTYNHPYNLDFVNDPFAKSLVLIKYEFFRENFPIFLENFNSQLNKLSFFKLTKFIMYDLGNVVAWIEKANRSMFNHFNIKCVLYIIENQYQEIDAGVFRQKRRSFPLETIFFDAFPEMYQALLRYIKAKLMSRKSEIRLALVFKRYTKSKQIKTEMRIKMMMENDSINAYQLAVNKQESVLFDETDQDKDEERITYANRPHNARQSRDGVNESQASLTSNYSNIQMHLDSSNKIKAIKLVDKTKRAFSISIESSKAFELAIRKPRRKLKHKITRFRSWLYGIYLLLIKYHGKPPSRREIWPYIVIYSAVVALDIMLLFNFTMHLFLPVTNFTSFGWAFFFVYFAIPYLSPIIAIISALVGSVSLMKSVGNLNAFVVCYNIPITLILAGYQNDDPQYLLLLVLMITVKIALSGISAKICQNLVNPRYKKNQEKLVKIMKRQKERLIKREEILGKEAVNQIEGIGPQKIAISSGKLGKSTGSASLGNIRSTSNLESTTNLTSNVSMDTSGVNTEALRDKLLE